MGEKPDKNDRTPRAWRTVDVPARVYDDAMRASRDAGMSVQAYIARAITAQIASDAAREKGAGSRHR